MTNPQSPDDLKVVAREQAERIIYELLGHRWVWPAITVTEVVDLHPGHGVISLQGRPIREIEYVRREGSEHNLGHVLESGYRVRLQEKRAHSTFATVRPRLCSGVERVEVRYTYGSPPPAPVERAIEELSGEIEKAMSGSGKCKLPERVTSVTREGLSMALIDPQDFLDKGRTGLPRVDMVLSTYNPLGSRRRAKVVGIATPLGARVTPPTKA